MANNFDSKAVRAALGLVLEEIATKARAAHRGGRISARLAYRIGVRPWERQRLAKRSGGPPDDDRLGRFGRAFRPNPACRRDRIHSADARAPRTQRSRRDRSVERCAKVWHRIMNTSAQIYNYAAI